MLTYHSILTHPGGAHKDEFLACCVLLAERPAPIVRREPTEAELADPKVCVVDVGHRHEPELHNFDHHQLPSDHTPTCSLSLILQHLGIYQDARQFCDWLEPVEWFDCRGPQATARWLGIPRESMSKLNSTVDLSLLRRFAFQSRITPGEPLWEIMRMIGQDITGYIRSLRARLDFLEQHVVFWDFDLGAEPGKFLFLPRTEPIPEEPSMALDRFVELRGLSREVVGLVYPDRRGGGYGLSRFRDNPRLDFARIAGESDVHFAHARGFVAKTSAADAGRLRELLMLAGASASR
ncbi:hypothetical protein IMCC26134_04750 [Verrucomicrobia bacterium IMCC26134]|jgi:hypothetical protein|nr:hypothetical protein IMCC26134_04750 [Verrucomicrobia bacterium IMCC26134]